MKHSKPGLNEPFYKWIDDVRRAIRKEKELQEKLKYYNKKLVGCKGADYGGFTGGGINKGDDDILYWLSKIEEIEKKISNQQILIDKYNGFLISLDSNAKMILKVLIQEAFSRKDHYEILNVSKQKYYDMINQIAKKRIEFFLN